MSFPKLNISTKVVSGDAVIPAILKFIETNASIMLEHDKGQLLNKNGYLFLRFGRYSVSIRTAFERDKLDDVEGIAFSAHVRRRRRHSFAETVIAMVIGSGASDKKRVPLRSASNLQSGGRKDN